MNIIVLIAVCCTLEVTQLLGCPEIKIMNGTVSYIRYLRAAQFTCDENFERVGEKLATCIAGGVWSTDIPFCVSTACPLEVTSPGLIVKKLYKGGVLSVTCDPGLVRIGSQRIMCLNGDWNKPLPVCAPILSMKCDFENDDLCGWSQDTEDEFDWRWHQGSTPTQNTGPSNDHTLQSALGHYLFIETDKPQEIGHRARLLSPVYTSGTIDGMCLQFYYHISGTAEVGYLDVYILKHDTTTTSSDNTQHIFHREGNQGDHWIQAEVYIPPSNTTLQIILSLDYIGKRDSGFFLVSFDCVSEGNCLQIKIAVAPTVTQIVFPANCLSALVFQATRLSGAYSDIAIDDVSLRNCSQSPELMLSLAIGASNTPGKLTTQRTSSLSTSAREVMEIISPKIHRNHTVDDSEKKKSAVITPTHSSIQEMMSTEKTHTNMFIPSLANPVSDKQQTDGNITLHNVYSLNNSQTDSDNNLYKADKIQIARSTPLNTYLSSHKTLTTNKISSLQNDVDNDQQINNSQNRIIFQTRHTIILTITMMFAALAVAWSWVRHRGSRGRVKQEETQKRAVNKTGCISIESRKKCADTLV